MKRRKRALDGAEIGDPVAVLELTNPQKEALGRYFSLRRAAGWGVRRITAQYDDPMFLGGDEGTNQEDRERNIKEFYEACDKALMSAGFPAHRAVANLFSFRIMTGRLSDVRRGSDALAVFFHISKQGVDP
jgi:hypothetical protein